MQIEVEMISPAYAVVDPWAVMIVAVHTSIADITVTTAWHSYNFTERA